MTSKLKNSLRIFIFYRTNSWLKTAGGAHAMRRLDSQGGGGGESVINSCGKTWREMVSTARLCPLYVGLGHTLFLPTPQGLLIGIDLPDSKSHRGDINNSIEPHKSRLSAERI